MVCSAWSFELSACENVGAISKTILLFAQIALYKDVMVTGVFLRLYGTYGHFALSKLESTSKMWSCQAPDRAN